MGLRTVLAMAVVALMSAAQAAQDAPPSAPDTLSGPAAQSAPSTVSPPSAQADQPNESATGSQSRSASSHVETSPLLAFAEEQAPPEISSVDYSAKRLRAIAMDLERHPPPANEDCAQTLGASRFARTHAAVASLRLSRGELKLAEEAHEAALACTPRDATLYASLASLYVTMGRLDDARAAIDRGRAIDADEPEILSVLARVDFLEERWADATARFRLIATIEEDHRLATFYQCFLWLAQRRAGVLRPELAVRDNQEFWPMPVLDLLEGDLTEEQLVEHIRDARLPRGQLVEALYYVGELRLAEGATQTARRHFAAAVSLKVLDYVEHGMAFTELAKLRDDPEPAALH
jgi:lipoprotein NlpI